MHEVLHVLGHAVLDSVKLLPFLFLTYLLMEFLEHRAGERIERAVARAGKAGPVIGGVLGLLPQCGFSAAIAGLFAGRVVTVGTVVAVFLATSDEMIAVFLGKGMPWHVVPVTLAVKLVVAVLVGFLVDLLFRDRQDTPHVKDLCEAEGCHCEKGIWRSALHHTLHIFLFVLIINVLLGALFEVLSAERIAILLNGVPVLGQTIAALIGLVPNCAASVAIATLYASGAISAGSMIAGLLTGAGAGLLVLFRANKHLRENLQITALLFVTALVVGCLLDYTGLAVLIGL